LTMMHVSGYLLLMENCVPTMHWLINII